MTKIKEFKVKLDSQSLNFSMHPFIPTINGVAQPMELHFKVEDPHGTIDHPIVLIVEKKEVVGILKELQRLTPLIKCFG